MNKQQKTKDEILDYVLDYYKTHNRGINAWGCVYIDQKNGNKCAVGLCAVDPQNLMDEFGGEAVFDIVGALGEPSHQVSNSFDQLLRPEFRGHSPEFWSELQAIHDNTINWREKKTREGNFLTEYGKEAVKELRLAIKTNTLN